MLERSDTELRHERVADAVGERFKSPMSERSRVKDPFIRLATSATFDHDTQ